MKNDKKSKSEIQKKLGKIDEKASAKKRKSLTKKHPEEQKKQKEQKEQKEQKKKFPLISSLSRTKISNKNKTSALRRKCQNKVKTLQISPRSAKILAQEQIFHSLACAKLSSHPQANLKLYKVILKALKENIAWPDIEIILQQNKQPKIDKNCYLLELKFKKKIFILISVRTTAHIYSLRKMLIPIWQKYNLCDASVLHHFKHNCLVEALAPYPTARDFADFEKSLAKDAVNCHAKGVGIMDYETGAVYFQCQPLQLPDVVEQLEKRKYKVLLTNYGFQAIERVSVDGKDRQQYKKFLSEVLKLKEVESYYDNLEESENQL